MLAPGVLVCERRGRYAARLRHQLAEQGIHVRVRETRSGKDSLKALHSRRFCAVVVEATSNPIAALELIAEVRAFDSSVLVLVVLDRIAQWVEGPAREFGATYCAVVPFELDLLADLIVRHLKRYLSEAPGTVEDVPRPPLRDFADAS